MFKKNKFHNEKIIVDGIKFDSKAEFIRWEELKRLERTGEIANLERQVKFEIVPRYEFEKGSRKRYYIADFVYTIISAGVRVIEDCKSEFTRKNPLYRLKRQLVQTQYCTDGGTFFAEHVAKGDKK